MKSDIHPDYHPVLFLDVSNGFEFLTNSTMTSDEKRTVDGIEAYVVRLDITSESHPFFTGAETLMNDTRMFKKGGRVKGCGIAKRGVGRAMKKGRK